MIHIFIIKSYYYFSDDKNHENMILEGHTQVLLLHWIRSQGSGISKQTSIAMLILKANNTIKRRHKFYQWDEFESDEGLLEAKKISVITVEFTVSMISSDIQLNLNVTWQWCYLQTIWGVYSQKWIKCMKRYCEHRYIVVNR